MAIVSNDPVAQHLPLRGAIFDFNGTLSDDEPLLFDIYLDLFSEVLGYDLTRADYFATLAGLSDPEIILQVLKRCEMAHHKDLKASLLGAKIARYCAEVAITPRISSEAVYFVNAIAEIVPIAVVTGAARVEVHAALQSAGIFDRFSSIVTVEDVRFGKPDPEGFLIAAKALQALSGDRPLNFGRDTIAVFEDSIFGILAAEHARMFPVVVGDPTPEFATGRLTIPSLCVESLATVLPLFSPRVAKEPKAPLTPSTELTQTLASKSSEEPTLRGVRNDRPS
ncbi:MAG: HAD family phosphatase [Acidimicrobiaceae bacterium]|nr:HAD family phosphatase [Acidimicrobiaceae bacterium]